MTKRNITVDDATVSILEEGKMPQESWTSYLTSLVENHPNFDYRKKTKKAMDIMMKKAQSGFSPTEDEELDDGAFPDEEADLLDLEATDSDQAEADLPEPESDSKPVNRKKSKKGKK